MPGRLHELAQLRRLQPQFEQRRATRLEIGQEIAYLSAHRSYVAPRLVAVLGVGVENAHADHFAKWLHVGMVHRAADASLTSDVRSAGQIRKEPRPKGGKSNLGTSNEEARGNTSWQFAGHEARDLAGGPPTIGSATLPLIGPASYASAVFPCSLTQQ